MSLTKIQIIKLLREQNPSLGLREAKEIVDRYEVKSFEERVVRALGEEAREELYSWARLYAVKTRKYQYEEIAAKNYRDWMPEPDEDTYHTVSETDLLYPTCDDDCCRKEA